MGVRSVLGRPGVRWGAAAAAAGAAAWSWWAFDSAPYPYAQHRLLDLPLPLLGQRRLESLLRPQRGERVLEIGPGTGLQSLRTAPRLGPEGRLDVVDVQQEMLDHVMARAAREGVTGIVPTRSDAGALPFPDGAFDAAYLVTALGETPDPGTTLTELRRVVRSGGRVVVGEFFDRHQVRRTALARHANAAGLHVTGLIGPPFAYFARLEPCRSARGHDTPPSEAHIPEAHIPGAHLPTACAPAPKGHRPEVRLAGPHPAVG
ncbi:class I SAM-dependent methyltransferase [Kitasatospora phosalacinea]|uniref:class I SAM-dependent methyltransferase n=1 Tax=Kitasatospora phosalacinea TaxID=2065 RepID=UPI001AE0CA3C|nr:class I SAM-dependent methyltransferase [Kitasatospora phosalacinea]